MNAILGALGQGDIGTHFPDSDPTYEGISSEALMRQVLQKMRMLGFRVVNADLTVIAERPRLTPHFEAIRQRLTRVLEVADHAINVKANTMEGLGPLGEGRGMAALAVVLLEKRC
jgi:2-C-methyl-D-erythritol 2,4-cyclodiphosphate synthase